MPRNWSYRKYTNDLSAAQRERNPPSNLTLYTVLLIAITAFFVLFMTYTTIRTAIHPPREGVVQPDVQPKDE